ncbi:MAG: hypothetical protein IPL75_12395 [Acidobacteria bacterium]|nr:hypothetical protein [Acidobacteriota bacterium]
MEGLVEVRPSRLFGSAGVTWEHSTIVYLDDATVTGESMRRFLLRTLWQRKTPGPSQVIVVPLVSRFEPTEELFFSELCSQVSSGAALVQFSFVPLFRLPVPSSDAFDRTGYYRHVTRVVRVVSQLDDELRAFGERLRKRLILGESHTGGLQHPFAVGPSSQAPLSADAIAIRHLLALQNHTAGVIGVLLDSLLHRCKAEDQSLVVLFATEPELLTSPLIRSEVQRDVAELAARVLSKVEDESVRSDALFVLAVQRRLIKALPSVLPSIASSRVLTVTAISLLLALNNEPDLWTACEPAVVAAQAREVDAVAGTNLHYFATSLRSFSRSLVLPSITNDHDARKYLLTVIAHMSYHGRGLAAFNRVTTWQESRASLRDARRGDEVRQILNDAMRIAYTEVVPGVEGLIYWARRKSPQHIEALSTLLFSLKTDLGRLESALSTLTAAAVGQAGAESLGQLWSAFRGRTLVRSTEVVLSREFRSQEQLSLEVMLPRFFSLPFEIVTRIAAEGEDVEVSWDRGEPGTKHLLVVAPFPRDVVSRLCDLLVAGHASAWQKKQLESGIRFRKHRRQPVAEA